VSRLGAVNRGFACRQGHEIYAFSKTSTTISCPNNRPSYWGKWGSFLGIVWPWRDAGHSTPFNARGSMSSWHVGGRNFTV